MDIAANLDEVRLNIKRSAEKVGRDPHKVKLLAVSKTRSLEAIEQAYQVGQRIFAENRVSECLEKISLLPNDCEWHIIGRLQTNKVKYLNTRITLIHSLDRLDLLAELEKRGIQRNQIWQTLIQVNITRDQAKAGLLPEEAADFLTVSLDHPHVRILGLMTIGSLESSVEETRTAFRELRILRDELQRRFGARVELRELSMGMSQDYELAIEEGATMVRIGRQIFGER